MKRKLLLSSAMVLGVFLIGPRMVDAQDVAPLPMEDISNGNQVANVPDSTDQSLTKICVEADGAGSGVVIFLPGSTDLRTLNAYSAFCSVDSTVTLLTSCDCSGTTTTP